MIVWRYVQIYVCIHGSVARVVLIIVFLFLCVLNVIILFQGIYTYLPFLFPI